MQMEVQETTLPNGIRVATATLPHVESVALGVWVGVGGRYECASLSGISHFIEHLLFKGTARLSAREISRAIEGRGGYCNAFTQEEMTCYYARVADEHTWSVFKVLAEMYFRPRFAPPDIEKERAVIIEEIMMYRDQPKYMTQEMLSAILWKDHALGRPLIGTPETLRSLTREHLLAFKKEKYVPANTVLVLAGRVNHAECVARISHILPHSGTRAEPTYGLVTSKVLQERLALQSKEIEQAQLALGFRIFGRFDQRRYALKVLNVILGENMSSRLFQLVREKHGLAYAVHSSIQLFADSGALAISAGLDPDKQVKTLELIIREANRLKDKLVSSHELARAKEYIAGQLRLALESPAGQMMWMGEQILNHRSCLAPENELAAIKRVTAEEVRAVASAVFCSRQGSLAVLAPRLTPRQGDPMQALLKELD